jgi:hypothetical protein
VNPMQRVLLGLQILEAALGPAEAHGFVPGHDEIWCDGPKPDLLDPADLAILNEAGWTWDDDMGWHLFV